MQSVSSAEKKSLFFRFINGVEVVGNKLPHPFYLFCILCVIAVALSVIFSGASISYMSASSSGGGEKMVTATVRNLLNRETVTYVTENMYKIYYNFAPMMMVGLLMLAIGLADQVGFFSALIRRTILGARPSLVFAVVSFIAINAHIASNAGVLGCTTVAAAVFALLGYNPWLGIILAYAAGNAGMAASVFAGNLDVLISGINVSVCTSLGIDPSTVHVLEHWYFLIASLVLLTVAYTLITTKFVRGFIGEPKDLSLVLGKETEHELTPIERKGLRNAGIAAVIFFAVLIAACIPQNSFFRAPDGSIVPNSPLLKSVLTLLFLFFQITAMAYGRTVGKIAKWNDMPKMMSKSIGLVTSFMVIALPASLFIYLFNASNIPTVLGATGAQWLKEAGFNGLLLLIVVALMTCFLDLFMTSGSSKWMILAPILIPMFYAVDISPAMTSLAYRIGDSAMNAVAPISSDVALIVGLLVAYNTDKDKTPGMGTVFAGCMPYAIVTIAIQIALLCVWWVLGLPLGPGVTQFVK